MSKTGDRQRGGLGSWAVAMAGRTGLRPAQGKVRPRDPNLTRAGAVPSGDRGEEEQGKVTNLGNVHDLWVCGEMPSEGQR